MRDAHADVDAFFDQVDHAVDEQRAHVELGVLLEELEHERSDE